MTENIILTGFMGTGKTAVAKHLSQLLGWTLVDTDALIQSRDGRSIPQIFSESGEAAFRAMERAVTLELAEQDRLVVSTGGGLMLDEVNAAVLGEKGRVFCLTAEVDQIMARLSNGDGVVRPLLAGPNPKERIETLLAQRRAGYGQFVQVATDGKRPLDVARFILNLLNNER